MEKKILSIVVLSLFLFTISCGGGSENKTTKEAEDASIENSGSTKKGIGPVKNITLAEEIDLPMSKEGEAIFKAKCSACHKTNKRFVGPAMKGVTERREPEWIMNMILNPEVMVKEDPTAKKLLAEYLSPMANQNLSEKEARSVLEYFRTLKE